MFFFVSSKIITHFIRKMKIVSGNILKAASILTTTEPTYIKTYPKTEHCIHNIYSIGF